MSKYLSETVTIRVPGDWVKKLADSNVNENDPWSPHDAIALVLPEPRLRPEFCKVPPMGSRWLVKCSDREVVWTAVPIGSQTVQALNSDGDTYWDGSVALEEFYEEFTEAEPPVGTEPDFNPDRIKPEDAELDADVELPLTRSEPKEDLNVWLDKPRVRSYEL